MVNTESLTDLIKSNVNDMELYSDKYPFNLPLRISGFENEKEYIYFIKSCEKLIRLSPEYRCWKKYISDVLQVQSCAISNENMEETTVAVHHHIPSMFLLVKAIINKKIKDEKSFSSFDISLDVMELHFCNYVGFVPIITSLHEKFHNGFLKIPIEHVHGDYKHFIDNYFQYLDDSDINIISERLAVKIVDCVQIWGKGNYPGVAM